MSAAQEINSVCVRARRGASVRTRSPRDSGLVVKMPRPAPGEDLILWLDIVGADG